MMDFKGTDQKEFEAEMHPAALGSQTEAAKSLELAASFLRSHQFSNITFILQQCSRCRQFLDMVTEDDSPALTNAVEQLVQALQDQMQRLQVTADGAVLQIQPHSNDLAPLGSNGGEAAYPAMSIDALERGENAMDDESAHHSNGDERYDSVADEGRMSNEYAVRSMSQLGNVDLYNEGEDYVEASFHSNDSGCTDDNGSYEARGSEYETRTRSRDNFAADYYRSHFESRERIADPLPMDNRQKERYSIIEQTIVEKSSVRFTDVAGLEEAKRTLREAIVVPIQFPHLFTGGLEPWRRILLYGPPGTGKSYLARAVSSEIESTFYCVSAADIMSSLVGESEKLIKDLFQQAKQRNGKSVIFIDEVDSVCRRRSTREEEYTRRIKTELLKQMEGVASGHDDMFLMCATNCPWELDPAFLRRFQKRIYIPLPDIPARVGIMKKHATACRHFSDEQWLDLAERMEDYSGSDVATVTLGALFQPVRDLQSAQHWFHDLESDEYTPCDPSVPDHIRATMYELPAPQVIPRAVEMEDFVKSITEHRRTVTNSDLERFDEFTRAFGFIG